MVNWSVVQDPHLWEQSLAALGGEQYTQVWGWGEHRARFGWQPVRIVARDEGDRLVAQVQFLVRRLPGGVGIVWIPGGPIGDVPDWAGNLRGAIKSASGLRFLLLKISALRATSTADEAALRSHGWKRPRDPLNSGRSMMWDIGPAYEARLAGLSTNWRHNLRRSAKYGLRVERWEAPDPVAIAALYAEMESRKGLSPQFSPAEIASVLQSMQERLLFYRCLDHEGSLIAMRACLLVGDQAWDFMAVSGVAARKVYASYALLWELVQDCHLRGLRKYDLGGIDPAANKGVWDFKRGTGAAELAYLGEWETASPGWMGWLLNLAISLRRGRT